MECRNPKKHLLRVQFLQKRKALPFARREAASKAACHYLLKIEKNYQKVLSFFPIFSEIDISPLNDLLAKKKKLLFPKIEQDHLHFFLVTDPSKQLINKGRLKEPNPLFCDKIPTSQIDLALIPGLTFDAKGYRIGYGKGFYDRCMDLLPKGKRWGIGFYEQLSFIGLNLETQDKAVDRVLFF